MEFWVGWPIWAAYVTAAIVLLLLYLRHRWKKLVSSIQELPAALIELRKAGKLEERLTIPAIERLWRASVESAGKRLAELNLPELAASLASHQTLNDSMIARLHSLMLQSLKTGELRSVLLEKNGQHLYFLAVPGRCEHPQLLRRFPALAQGWLQHISALRRAISDNASVHCFLFFVNHDARDSLCAYGFESDSQRIATETLLEHAERDRTDVRVVRAVCEISL